MEDIVKYYMLIVFMLSMVEAKTDLESIVREMRMEMSGLKVQLTLTQNLEKNYYDLQKEQDKLKNKNIQLEEHIRFIEDELTVSKEQLKKINDEFRTELQELERNIRYTKDNPFFHTCGYKHFKSINAQSMTYDSLSYNSTNIEGGGLDIVTGIFTSSYPGTYYVTWSLMAEDNAGDGWVWIYLRKNSHNIDESFHKSFYTGPSGWVDNMGRLSQYLHNCKKCSRREDPCTTS